MKKFFLTTMLLFICTPVLFAEEELNRRNVTDELAKPKRVKADDLFYAKLGYGSFLSTFDSHGTSFGFGYRYEMDQVAVDVSFANTVFGHKGNSGLSFTYLRLQGLYFFSPLSNSSLYLGAGLGYGSRGIENDDGNFYTSHGLEGTASVGFETMRVSNIRLFVQLDATFPMDDIEYEGESVYAPTIALSMGIGF